MGMAIVRDMTDDFGFVCYRGANKARYNYRSRLIGLVVEATKFVVPKIRDLAFFDERKNQAHPSAVAIHYTKWRHAATGVMEVLDSQADLLDIVGALCSARGFAGSLDGGKQKRDEDADNCDDNQQLDERERSPYTVTTR
jgi:hypothetical protein